MNQTYFKNHGTYIKVSTLIDLWSLTNGILGLIAMLGGKLKLI
jgi:hypothetical protein